MKFAQVESYAFSDIGPFRSINEDLCQCHRDNSFFIIADGMGGHKAGEIAAHKASNNLCNFFLHPLKKHKHPLTAKEIQDYLHKAIEDTNKEVFHLSRSHKDYMGMGTTLSCLYLYDGKAFLGHVGDSRIYRLRNNQYTQLTKDHSLASEIIKDPSITTHHHVLTQAIGVMPSVDPYFALEPIVSNDIFVLCTDGLSDHISNKEFLFHFSKNIPLEKIGENLIIQAKKNGSHDNMSIIIVKIIDIYEKDNLSR